jgi:hypothetical protein
MIGFCWALINATLLSLLAWGGRSTGGLTGEKNLFCCARVQKLFGLTMSAAV